MTRGDRPPRDRLEYCRKYLREFLEYQPGKWPHPQREKAENCVAWLVGEVERRDEALRDIASGELGINVAVKLAKKTLGEPPQ